MGANQKDYDLCLQLLTDARARCDKYRDALEKIANCGYVCDVGDVHMRDTARQALGWQFDSSSQVWRSDDDGATWSHNPTF
jgi:hypothetical protein